MNRKNNPLLISFFILVLSLTACLSLDSRSESDPAFETQMDLSAGSPSKGEADINSDSLNETIESPSAYTGTWTFAVVGDTHVWAENSETMREMAAALISENPDLVLFPGDIVQAGLRTSEEELVSQLELWQELAAPLSENGVAVYPLRGNHEADANDSAAVWQKTLGTALPQNGPADETGLTYAFTHKNAIFIGLDHYTDIHRSNQEWLDEQLAGNNQPVVIVFGHEPAFKAFHTDTMDDDPNARDAFWKSLSKAGARVYFCGHDHFFDMTRIDDGDGDPTNDIYQAIVGSGGSTLAMPRYRYNGENSSYRPENIYHNADRYGFLLVEVNVDGSLSLIWKARVENNTNGTVEFIEEFTFSIPATPNTAQTENEQADQSAVENMADSSGLAYPIVDTGQGRCYDDQTEIPCQEDGDFYGQDAHYTSNPPAYRDNGDGTVSDLVTGLMWQQDPGEKVTFEQAIAGAGSLDLAGHTDWRLPTIKELYSLIRFDGGDVSPCMMGSECLAKPFIDNRYFNFEYGDTTTGDRVIDSQYWSATEYVSTTMNRSATTFGVNFADGRIKGYPSGDGPGGGLKTEYALYVRGNPDYGKNDFNDNGDGTVFDDATGLTWMQSDSGNGMDWNEALGYCENLNLAGQTDWRLPDAKELQSIVDYTRSPLTSNSAAIDPVFKVSKITNEAGVNDYPFFWSSTTHADSSGNGEAAAYVAFGTATGNMGNGWIDVHGAGAQRSDPKAGNPADFAQGRGPQGDSVRIDNYVRCVRGGANLVLSGQTEDERPSISIEGSGAGQTQPGNRPSNPGEGQAGPGGTAASGPPQEAVDACAGKPAGAACQFTSPNGAVSGVCRQIRQYVCLPADQP